MFDYKKPFRFKNRPEREIIGVYYDPFDDEDYKLGVVWKNNYEQTIKGEIFTLDGKWYCDDDAYGSSEDYYDDLVNIEDFSEEINVVETMLGMLVPKFNYDERGYFTKVVNSLVEKLKDIS